MPLRQLYPDLNGEPISDAGAIDIVAVHGLNPRSREQSDHALNTWSIRGAPEGQFWLRDYLPHRIPNGRIFIYEYDSTAVYGYDHSTFVDKADALLEAMRTKRRGLEGRPILLLGHSLGGLLIKQALINAHFNDKYQDIEVSTRGIAFFATPHNGGDRSKVALGRIAAKVALHFGFQKGDNILDVLSTGSIFVDAMQNHWRHLLIKYNIISFWGTLDEVVPRESALFGLPEEHRNIVALQASHKGVCKFGSSQVDKDNLELVVSNLQDLYENAIKKNEKSLENNERNITENVDPGEHMNAAATAAMFNANSACLQSLAYAEMESRYHTIEEPVGNTCTWLLQNNTYRAWQTESSAADSNNVLWIQGQPGSGKSTLMKQAFLQTASEVGRIVKAAFFFNSRGSPMERNLDGFFRSVLHQILQQGPPFLLEFASRYAKKDAVQSPGWSWHTKEMEEYLHHIIVHHQGHKILLFIDALDECDTRDLRHVVDFVNKIAASATTSACDFRLCLASRRFPNISLNKYRDINIEDYNAPDIAALVSERLREMEQEDMELMRRIVDRSSNVFLWAVLVLVNLREAIEDGEPQSMLIEIVESVPEDLSALFTKCMNLISTRERAESYHMFLLVLFAARPLTVTEYRHALVLSDPNSNWTESQVVSAQMKDDGQLVRLLRKRSRGLIELNTSQQSQIVQFFHASVREFLLYDGIAVITPSPREAIPLEGHKRLKLACVNFLRAHSLPQHNISRYQIWDAKRELISLRTDFPFSDYAVSYLFSHAAESEKCGQSQIEFLEQLRHSENKIFSRWKNYFHLKDFSHGKGYQAPTLLYSTSCHGLFSCTQVLLQQGEIPDALGGYLGFPLQAAAFHGHLNTVELLLKYGAQVDAISGFYGTALQAAVAQGHRNVVEGLLDYGASADLEGGHYGTPIHAAACKGDVELVQTFLQRGVSVEKVVSYWASSTGSHMNGDVLVAAISEDHQLVVEIILQNLTISPEKHIRVLEMAILKKYSKVIEIFLKNLASHKTIDAHVKQLLPLAASAGQDGLAIFLLQHGAEIDSHGQYADYLCGSISEGNALQAAASQSHDHTVDMLINKGAKIDIESGEYSHVLLAAISAGSTAIVRNLLTHGANPDVTGRYWSRIILKMVPGNALFAAVSNGYEEIVVVLLSFGADPNKTHGAGRYALIEAASRGQEEIVRSLLSHGADISHKGLYYKAGTSRPIVGTALDAALAGRYSTVAALLSNGTIQKQDCTEPSPLAVQDTELSRGNAENMNKRDFITPLRTSKPIQGVIELENTRKIGWMNSTIQFLRSAEQITSFFLGTQYIQEINYDNILGYKGQVAMTYADVLRSIYKSTNSLQSTYNEFMKTVARTNPNFVIGQPADAQELLGFMLDGLGEDLQRIKKRVYTEIPTLTGALLTTEDIQEHWKSVQTADLLRSDSIISDLFRGYYKNTIECPLCGNTETLLDYYYWLQVPLPPPHGLQVHQNFAVKGPPSIRDCLTELGKGYVLSKMDQWYCRVCKDYQRAYNRMEIWTVPELLIINIRRFTSDRGASSYYGESLGFPRVNIVSVPVEFPLEGLDLTEFVTLDEGKSLVYDLIAVINFDGTQQDNSAHYTAFGKNFCDQKWYEYDDNHVYERIPPSALNATHFLYKRRSPDEIPNRPKSAMDN